MSLCTNKPNTPKESNLGNVIRQFSVFGRRLLETLVLAGLQEQIIASVKIETVKNGQGSKQRGQNKPQPEWAQVLLWRHLQSSQAEHQELHSWR
jgi:hypothetical protein